MKEQWKHEMQQKMAAYRQTAPRVSWPEVEKAVSSARQSRRAVLQPLFRRMAVAAAVVLLFVGGWWTFHQHDVPNGSGASEARSVTPDTTSRTVALTASPDTSTTAATPINNIVASVGAAPVSARAASVGADPVSAHASPTEDVTAEDTLPQHEKTLPQVRKPMKATAHQQTPVSPTRPLPTVTSGRLTATLFLANTMAGYTASGFFLSQDNGYQPPAPPVSNGETISDAGWYGADVSSEPSTDKDDDDGNGSAGNSRATHPDEGQVRTDEHVRHHQPVRFGVMLRYRLDRRWSLESGLTYSRLTSDFTQTTGQQILTTEQKLTFIGIPLNVGYQLWTSRRFSVYASAGGMAEKMVKGSSEARRWTSKTACQDLPLKDLRMHRLQFSVNGALGMDYRLSRLLCLYAEPGISYYFDNGSSLSTIYRDKPLNFSLNLGIRLQLPDFRRESGQ